MEDASRQAAHVVAGCHRLTISTCRTDGDEVAATGERERIIMGKHVGGLAHGAYDIVGFNGLSVAMRCEVLYLMVSTIEGRSDQVGHACVEDDKLLVAVLLDKHYSADE